MKSRTAYLLVTCLLLTNLMANAGCSDLSNGLDQAGLTHDGVTVDDLPLLSTGQHVSFTRGFNAIQPAATNAAMAARWEEAVSKGMDVGRIQLDWVDLEPQSNQFDKQFLEDRLMAMNADGLQSFVLLSVVDSEVAEGYAIPDDLSDPDSSTLLANSMKLNDPVILSRFNKLLDWVVPMIVAHGGWVLSVGNEPGNYLADSPSMQPNLVGFLSNARTHAHSIDPELAVTMTLAFTNLERGFMFHRAFLEQSDVASFNYYAVDSDFYFDGDTNTITREIDQMLVEAGNKSLILQELGAAAGYEDKTSTLTASLTGQQRFYETVFRKMESEPRFRVAVIFQLVDWDPGLVDTFYSRPFAQEGMPRDFIDRFAESLETTGLIRYTDGSRRPAWSTVRSQIEKFKAH